MNNGRNDPGILTPRPVPSPLQCEESFFMHAAYMIDVGQTILKEGIRERLGLKICFVSRASSIALIPVSMVLHRVQCLCAIN